MLEDDEVVSALKKETQIKGVCEKILHSRVIRQSAQERNITVTAEEIQTEADRFRYQNRLEKAADTMSWLDEQLITVEDWEAGIQDRLLSQKLAEHLFSGDVEQFFVENRINFEQVILYQIVIPYEKLAFEIFYQIMEREVSFYEAAHLYDIDAKRRYQCGFEGKLYRRNLAPDVSSTVFSANEGEVIGPVKLSSERYHLLMVEDFIQPDLTPEIYREILDGMFRKWLEGELNHLIHNTKQG